MRYAINQGRFASKKEILDEFDETVYKDIETDDLWKATIAKSVIEALLDIRDELRGFRKLIEKIAAKGGFA